MSFLSKVANVASGGMLGVAKGIKNKDFKAVASGGFISGKKKKKPGEEEEEKDAYGETNPFSRLMKKKTDSPLSSASRKAEPTKDYASEAVERASGRPRREM